MTDISTHDLSVAIAKISETFPTLDEAIVRFVQRETLDGRDANRLLSWIPTARWGELGVTLREGVTPEALAMHDAEISPWTPESFAEQMRADVEFGFEKALNQRGISSSLMHAVVEQWLRILGIREQFTEEYAQYGLPLFKQVALAFGFPNPIGDDAGNESQYAG